MLLAFLPGVGTIASILAVALSAAGRLASVCSTDKLGRDYRTSPPSVSLGAASSPVSSCPDEGLTKLGSSNTPRDWSCRWRTRTESLRTSEALCWIAKADAVPAASPVTAHVGMARVTSHTVLSAEMQRPAASRLQLLTPQRARCGMTYTGPASRQSPVRPTASSNHSCTCAAQRHCVPSRLCLKKRCNAPLDFGTRVGDRSSPLSEEGACEDTN